LFVKKGRIIETKGQKAHLQARRHFLECHISE
jgi:hypothetical protein